jgi:hypothetical protein
MIGFPYDSYFPDISLPPVSMLFEEALTLLQHAPEAFDIPHVSEYRATLALHACP